MRVTPGQGAEHEGPVPGRSKACGPVHAAQPVLRAVPRRRGWPAGTRGGPRGAAAALGELGLWKSARPRPWDSHIFARTLYFNICFKKRGAVGGAEVVLFFTSMFPAASLYHLPCQTVSGMWCRVPAVGRARSALRPQRAGRTGTGSCPRTRPPGNAAPHRAEARTQTRPVFRSSPRWPRAPSGMPPSSPEGQPGPAPAAAAAGPDRLCPQGERPQVQPAPEDQEGIGPAHLCSYGADPGLFFHDRKRQEQLGRERP